MELPGQSGPGWMILGLSKCRQHVSLSWVVRYQPDGVICRTWPDCYSLNQKLCETSN
jgi:hypothetical protein